MARNSKEYIWRVKFAVQVNGKTRDIIKVKKNEPEKNINQVVLTQSKAKKYIEDKKILKTIFVSNKIINYIVDDHDKNL